MSDKRKRDESPDREKRDSRDDRYSRDNNNHTSNREKTDRNSVSPDRERGEYPSENREKKSEEGSSEELDSRRLYIANITDRIREEELRNAFNKYGQVRDVRVIVDAHTGRSKGYAFLTMETNEDGVRAQKEADGKLELDGKAVVVEIARGKEREPGSYRRSLAAAARYDPYERRGSGRLSYPSDPRPDSYRPSDYRSPGGRDRRYPDYPPAPFPVRPVDFPLLPPPYLKDDRYGPWSRRDYPGYGRDYPPYPPGAFPPRMPEDFYRGPPPRAGEFDRDRDRERDRDRDRDRDRERGDRGDHHRDREHRDRERGANNGDWDRDRDRDREERRRSREGGGRGDSRREERGLSDSHGRR